MMNYTDVALRTIKTLFNYRGEKTLVNNGRTFFAVGKDNDRKIHKKPLH